METITSVCSCFLLVFVNIQGKNKNFSHKGNHSDLTVSEPYRAKRGLTYLRTVRTQTGPEIIKEVSCSTQLSGIFSCS